MTFPRVLVVPREKLPGDREVVGVGSQDCGAWRAGRRREELGRFGDEPDLQRVPEPIRLAGTPRLVVALRLEVVDRRYDAIPSQQDWAGEFEGQRVRADVVLVRDVALGARLDQLVLQPDVCPAAVRDLVRRRYRPERRAAVRRAGKRQRPPAPVRDPQVARVVGGRPLDRRIERGGIGRRDDEAAASPDHLVHLRDGPIEVDQREREVLRLQIGLGHALVTAVHVPDRRDANAGEGVVRVSHHDEVRRRLHGQLLCEPREVLALQVGSSRTFRVVAPPEPRRPGGEEVGEVALRLVHSRRPSTRKHDRLGRRHPGVVADVGQHRRDDVVARSEPQRDQPEHVDLAHSSPGLPMLGLSATVSPGRSRFGPCVHL